MSVQLRSYTGWLRAELPDDAGDYIIHNLAGQSKVAELADGAVIRYILTAPDVYEFETNTGTVKVYLWIGDYIEIGV